jgi:ribosomal protein S18 acetylase RimI-like enzyme
MPSIRITGCTALDATAAIPLIYSSGPAEFRYAFSVDYAEQALDFLHFAFTREQGQFSYKNHVGIYVDNQLTGIAAYWTRNDLNDFMRRHITDILSYYGIWKGAGVLLRGLQVEQVMREPGKDCGYIANVGVAESARGQGIGQQLMEHQIQRSRMEQLKACELDVRVGNPARNLYERLGFRDQITRHSQRSNRFGAINSHTRMRLPL